jgi:hypothetical protein
MSMLRELSLANVINGIRLTLQSLQLRAVSSSHLDVSVNVGGSQHTHTIGRFY